MPPPLRSPSVIPSTSCAKQLRKTAQSRSFSSTPQRDQRATRARRQFFRWLGTQGQNFLNPLPNSTNYLSAYNAAGQLKRVVEAASDRAERSRQSGGTSNSNDNNESGGGNSNGELPPETVRDLRPFPMNPAFVSQPVLSEEMREKIWERIMKKGQSVREVSASLGVEMSRIGAVVRLMEIEKEWQRIGKPLARPYAKAVMSMLPQTHYRPDDTNPRPHESINDLPLHAATGAQIFYPTSESRHFTRTDAARIFDDNLLPADDRVPHPELTLMHKDFKAGMPQEQILARQRAREEAEAKRKQAALDKRKKDREEVQIVDNGRWHFRFTDINVDEAGKDGRGYRGVGWRYGVPSMDRSRGAIKIPTRVE